MEIVELYLVNSVGKWGAGPHLREETSPERSAMEVQWGKLITQKREVDNTVYHHYERGYRLFQAGQHYPRPTPRTRPTEIPFR